jgi:phospho-N-acetylmuramoyl-pentapeptide-transferase
MLYHLFHPLQQTVSGFRLFDYITFRAAWAAILAFLVATVVGPGILASLKRRKVAGYVATGSGPVDEERARKAAVPTMGGVILLIGVALSGFLFARLDVAYTWIVLLSFLAFGVLGALDDWKKLKDPKSTGLRERHKLLGQLAIAFVTITTLYALGNAQDGTSWTRGPSMKPSPYAGWTPRHVVEPGDTWASLAKHYYDNEDNDERARQIARYNGRFARSGMPPEPLAGREIRLPPPWPDPDDHHRADLQVPFVKGFCLDLGWLFIPLGILVIVGASNAVNLTDGLDGLAIGTTATVASAFAVIAYVVGRVDFSRELHLFYVQDGGELAVIGAALVGGSLGFLWFNSHPAQVFMGDTGSLSIGGILGVLAVSLRHELTLAIAGGMFVAEAGSVIAQRSYFKLSRRAARRRGDANPQGKRLFLCAPLHHHYQFKGLHENKVTVRFWIVSVVCVLVALASLKMR